MRIILSSQPSQMLEPFGNFTPRYTVSPHSLQVLTRSPDLNEFGDRPAAIANRSLASTPIRAYCGAIADCFRSASPYGYIYHIAQMWLLTHYTLSQIWVETGWDW